MRSYETVIAFDQNLGESAIKNEVKRIQGIFSAHGAANLQVTPWGKKEFPHISNRTAPGYFVCYTFESGTGTTVAEVESILRITDSVAKFQSHRTNLPLRKFKGNPKATGADEDFGDLGDADF